MSVFVNRTINLKKIKAVGFDMDYTLVQYNSEEFEKMTHQAAINKLISVKKYPIKLNELKFNFDLAIQGLVIDKSRGNILKVSRYGKVKLAYYGLDPLPFEKQQEVYSNRTIDLTHDNFQSLDTSFAISNGVLFLQLMQLKKDGMELPDSTQLANDIREAIDLCHSDGSLKANVKENIDRFIIQDPDVVKLLEIYKAQGKKLIVITNSDFHYTKLLLDYTINPFLKSHKSWQDLFQITITMARKPSYFTISAPYLEIDPATGFMSNHFGPIKSGVFQGGFAGKLQHDLGLKGQEILYLGDHIYGDVVSIKKTFDWRTALVLGPLLKEIQSIKKSKPVQDKIDQLMEEKLKLENKIHKWEETQYINPDHLNDKERLQINETHEKMDMINSEISQLINQFKSFYNPYWGELMRAGQEESRMADQVEKYACLYMSKVTDLLNYGPRTYFRPVKRILPHEI